MPPPGPCDAKALAGGSSSAAAMARIENWDVFRDMAISRDNRLREATDKVRAGFENLQAKAGTGIRRSAFILPAQTCTFTPLWFLICVGKQAPHGVGMSPTQGGYT
jgi:hypothetical protein